MALNPEDFIITRKRKKYKFALFANSPLCFEFDEWPQEESTDMVVEIGAGTGQFLVELAERHPDRIFVAVDVKADRLQKGAREAEVRGISNVRFLRARADQLVEIFKPNSIRELWLTFSDPFPKKRSAGRRLTHPHFLAQYRQMLTVAGVLKIKHDNPEFFQWTLEQLVTDTWRVIELSFDLHESELSDDYKILTPYETRWLDEGRITQFVSALPK
jgi:tRNA (guanine-N7-)-methyltransferase